MKTLKELLMDLPVYELTEDDPESQFEEVFIDCIDDVVWEGNRDERRWYTYVDKVVKVPVYNEDKSLIISSRFYLYQDMECSGDGSKYDDDWSLGKINSLKEVFPHQVMTTIYK